VTHGIPIGIYGAIVTACVLAFFGVRISIDWRRLPNCFAGYLNHYWRKYICLQMVVFHIFTQRFIRALLAFRYYLGILFIQCFVPLTKGGCCKVIRVKIFHSGLNAIAPWWEPSSDYLRQLHNPESLCSVGEPFGPPLANARFRGQRGKQKKGFLLRSSFGGQGRLKAKVLGRFIAFGGCSSGWSNSSTGDR